MKSLTMEFVEGVGFVTLYTDIVQEGDLPTCTKFYWDRDKFSPTQNVLLTHYTKANWYRLAAEILKKSLIIHGTRN